MVEREMIHDGYGIVEVLTPWSRIVFEKLIVTQLVKEIPTFYATWRLITVFTRAHTTGPYPGPGASSPHPISL